jgi:glycosyltransferase involved in cell wall biosynthesis
MIIGIDASRANRPKPTGVESYAFHVIQEWKKKQIDDVRFVLYSDVPLQGLLADLPEGWTSKVLRWPPRRLWTQVRLSFEMLLHPPDVLFVPAHVVPIIHPKKTVMMVHDVAAARFPNSFGWFERWYSLWSARYAVQELSHVIVPSEFTKQELLSMVGTAHDFDPGRITVIHHGYDRRYRIVDAPQGSEHMLDAYGIKRPFVLSVGRLEEKKNTRRIVKAFDAFRRRHPAVLLRLVLIGKPGYGYEKVEEAMCESAYKKDIIHPGWIKEKDLVLLVNAAEALLIPSLYEGFGLPVLEAMACGTPVIAGTRSSLEEIGGDAALYVDPTNTEKIASLIDLIMSDEALREEKKKKGLERVRDFSWEVCATQTLNVLRKK